MESSNFEANIFGIYNIIMSVESILSILKNIRDQIQKTQINLAKCPKKRLTRGYLESKIESINGHWNTYNENHLELLKLTSDSDREKLEYFKKDEFGTVEEMSICVRADIKDVLRTSSEELPKTVETIKEPPLVRLPRIEIPKFHGSYEQWPTFKDLFTSLVDQNKTLTKVQKLHYLKTSLVGEPEVLLKHIQVTEQNYDQAWELLQSRYGNKKVIVNSIFKRLFSQRKLSMQTASNIKSLLDTTNECMNCLRNIEIDIASWDPVMIFLVVQKLDPETHKEWEEFAYQKSNDELPKWSELENFLQSKFRTLELVTQSQPAYAYKGKVTERSFAVSNVQAKSCVMCNEEHTISHCREFIKLTPSERSDYAKQNNLCFNCLIFGHSVNKCRLPVSCRVCRKRHHSLLHEKKSYPYNKEEGKDASQEVKKQEEIQLSSHTVCKEPTILLATALVRVEDRHGNTTVLRALIDQGSQASFLTERAAQLLKVERKIVKGTITGVGNTKTEIRHATQVKIYATHGDNFELNIDTYIMPTQITSYLPSKLVAVNNTWRHLHGLSLADPRYNQPGKIDMLLGAEVCALIMQGDIVKGPPGSPCALKTSLGWILFGGIEQSATSIDITVMHHSLHLDTMLKQMWELQPSDKQALTKEERQCEELYRASYSRTEDGKYVVKLPLKTEIPQATQGETREIALKRMKQLETRFEKNPSLKIEYQEVMKQYKEHKYIEEVPKDEINKPAIYLPQQLVERRDKETTKVRVVFDASSKGTNHVSLNDDLMVGPQLQDDLRSLIMRWRLRKICFLADIQKMYLQILVTKQDADYQRVLWREEGNKEIKDYRMVRVMFGTASAPYLAVRTLQQIAEDEGDRYPKARKVIKEDFYMDDLMSGEETEEEAIKLANEISKILSKGGFKLQKWASNSKNFLKQFEKSERSTNVDLKTEVAGTMKALGLTWNMGEDSFEYNLSLSKQPKVVTKRSILAELQHLFDPLGWLSPAVISAKMIVQRLWLHRVEWDDPVNEETRNEWLDLRSGFEDLKHIKISRWMHVTKQNMKSVTVHGFSDASEKAYAAVAYLRAVDENNEVKISMVAAKARVAPVKAITLPRLELCGAVLLSSLLKQIKESLKLDDSQIVSWTDSTIVLSWLQGEPTKWQTFVRNRVITILDNVGNKWYHVQSDENPADLASRGMPVRELKNNKLWWEGPPWLKDDKILLKRLEDIRTNLEMKKVMTINKVDDGETTNKTWEEKIDEYTTLNELLETIVICKRFLKHKKIINNDSKITTEELDNARIVIVKISQKQTFQEDIDRLKQKKPVKMTSNLKTLNPYIDDQDILRVGGRLRNSNLKSESKHPIILHNKGKLTRLIIADAHLKTQHGGTQLMLCYLRSQYWVLRAKSMIRSCIHKCLICARQRAATKYQIMGDLPEARVTPSRPFLRSGVDFAGPYDVLTSKGRGMKTRKAYICIFVCMSTKACHLELVGDLSAAAFIGAFRRFVARRGQCSHIWSDQGRNFVAANKELVEMWKQAKLEFQGKISEILTSEGTQWHFIPAYSPNFGGLWEAGVKSLKYHLKRIVNINLTFEEMTTVLCQIEACLNSRPLSPIDDTDPENLNPLTPGHFLISEAPVTVSTPNWKDLPISYLSRWQHLQKMLREFWCRWQGEYLTNLQQRSKWSRKQEEIPIGTIVLIKEENLPPGKWRLGRIIKGYPGLDGYTRVYDLKSGNSIIKRSLCKLCPMPIDLD